MEVDDESGRMACEAERRIIALLRDADPSMRLAACRAVLAVAEVGRLAGSTTGGDGGNLQMLSPRIASSERLIATTRIVYALIVSVQILVLTMYEMGGMAKEKALVPGLLCSLAGPFLSFTIARHNSKHRRLRYRDVISTAVSYVATRLSFADLYLIIEGDDRRAFGQPWGERGGRNLVPRSISA